MKPEAPFEDCSGIDDRIDERCDAFESAWRKGKRPGIGDFIDSDDKSYRNKLFRELLLVDVERRRSQGEQPTPEQYLREYPEFASQVDAVSFQYGATVFSTVRDHSDGVGRTVVRQSGSRVAHFELVELLGAGAMGEAWKAWDTRVKRNVTVKLPHSCSLSESDLRRFLREGEAAGQLNHPQLSSVHSIENDGNSFFIVAAFVEGANLKDYASKRRLPYDEIVDICARTGDALQQAHHEGVVHRDLKPANIIVDPNGVPHIIDFGLAKILDGDRDLTMNGELLGTPAYMSPELANGSGASADASTDVYSLGIILYELLTGRCPFDGNRGSVISQILACEPAPPRSVRATIPRDLETICLKAIEKAPANRYATAGDMAEDLRRFATGQPIRARRVGILEKCWRWIRRHPAMAASIAIVLAAAIAASSVIASLQSRNRRLLGFRPVYITTSPPGARVALVPLDPNTNEPDPDPARVVRPSGTTPLTTELLAGPYLVEAVGDDEASFAEVYRTVFDSSRTDTMLARANKKQGFAPDTYRFPDIRIVPQNESIRNMVRVVIPEDVRKQNPSLPTSLYVDSKQTMPADLKVQPKSQGFLGVTNEGAACISYPNAIRWAERNQIRLPSSAEYDSIVAAVQHGDARLVATNAPAKMEDLFDDFPELSTTTAGNSNVGGNSAWRLREMHVLKGFKNLDTSFEHLPWVTGACLAGPDAMSPKISIRGVRSATPRFVRP